MVMSPSWEEGTGGQGDGGTEGSPNGGGRVTDKHDLSEQSSPFLTRRGLLPPSVLLLSEHPITTAVSGAMLSGKSHKEHGRPRRP